MCVRLKDWLKRNLHESFKIPAAVLSAGCVLCVKRKQDFGAFKSWHFFNPVLLPVVSGRSVSSMCPG